MKWFDCVSGIALSVIPPPPPLPPAFHKARPPPSPPPSPAVIATAKYFSSSTLVFLLLLLHLRNKKEDEGSPKAQGRREKTEAANSAPPDLKEGEKRVCRIRNSSFSSLCGWWLWAPALQDERERGGKPASNFPPPPWARQTFWRKGRRH